MGEDIGHECGFGLVRLLKPNEYYQEKYGTQFFGLNRMYILMEKQRNRGTDGAGVANVKLDMPPGTKYIHVEKSIDKDPIADLFNRVQKNASEKLGIAPAEVKRGGVADPCWVKENVPFTGELFMAHVRYGTDSDNGVDKCHPVVRESNWMTRNLLLAGNFNITNNEDLFSSLVQVGQHPRELSDTVMLLERIGHYVDKENNDLYVKYSAMGHAPRTCFSLIAENINIARILRLASSDWDGGYCIAGMFGHGDAFVLRDPNGIRPCFFLANDEVVVCASEAPLIQTVFNVGEEHVKPVPPGQALVIQRSGQWSLERVNAPGEHLECSFERIYFSRGNDSGVYRQREALGRLLFKPLLAMIEAGGDTMSNTVLSFIPNTSELAYMGVMKQATEDVAKMRADDISRLVAKGIGGAELQEAIRLASVVSVRTEKVVHKDAKIRTFIQEDSTREHMTMHAYDVHYGTIRPGEDVLVAIDDSIVRGNTLRNAILRTLNKQKPKRIIVVASCPQIRYPDVYGIDMAKMGDLAAFKAAVTLLKERGMDNILTEVYKQCRAQLSRPAKSGGDFVNYVKRIYDPFTPEEITKKIVEQVTPSDLGVPVEMLFQTIEDLHVALPDHKGDWYFSGNYPTPGGAKVCCRAYVLWMEGSSSRCYGVNSAMSCVQTSVLVIGQGGSEHAMAAKLSHSNEVACVYVTPGNGGAVGPQNWGGEGHASAAPLIPVDVSLKGPGFEPVLEFCRNNDVKMVVIGSQEYLAEGLADVLRKENLLVFGPSQLAAEIESSNSFAEAFAKRHGIPKVDVNASPSTPRPRTGSDAIQREVDVSILALTDGASLSLFPYTIQNYKHALNGDLGPVTDGMGAVAPSFAVGSDMLERIEQEIARPTIKGLQSEGRPFIGCLQIELRITKAGPQVLRFRVTFSDLGAQVALPLLDCDLFELLSACAGGRLEEGMMKVRSDRSVVAVVINSGGFPGAFETGHTISGIDRARCVPGTHVFHNSTELGHHADRSTPARVTSSPMFKKRRSISTILEPSGAAIITSGGTVLTVAAIGRSISEARERAYVGVRAISFKDCTYRLDIAAVPVSPKVTPEGPPPSPVMRFHSHAKGGADSLTYLSAGVDSAASDAALEGFEPLIEQTKRKGCRTVDVPEQGLLSGRFCDMKELGYKDPIMISGTSNVGTKLKVACGLGKMDTVGIDLVALCVNDIVAQGAEPVAFHNHLATPKLDVQEALNVVKGIAHGCSEAGCALLDASTAELPGVFARNGCNMIGFVVGIVERKALLPKTANMAAGDVLIALPASGLHANGFSLARSVIRTAGLRYEQAAPFDPTRSLGEAFLTPTRIYSKPVLALTKEDLLIGAAHISSGGLTGSLAALLPQALGAHLKTDTWDLPTPLRWLAAVGKIKCADLASTFNCGLGMVFVVSQGNADRVMKLLRDHHEEPVKIGQLVARRPGQDAVEVDGAEGSWLMLPELGVSLPFPEVLSSLQAPRAGTRCRTVVLGGREELSVLSTLIQMLNSPSCASELVAVAGTDAGSKFFTHAKAAGLATTVLGAGAAEFSAGLQQVMKESQAQQLLILSDADTSLLTREFLEAWVGSALMVHDSLLPAFPEARPVEAALECGVCITGCTVCFALPSSSGSAGACQGPIIMQESTCVLPGDTVDSLCERLVSECQAKILPSAMQYVAEGAVVLNKKTGKFKLERTSSFIKDSGDEMSVDGVDSTLSGTKCGA